ncbi:biotin carboxyl carrier protein [Formosa agariphila KMM 3901]|uniref:Biotin carboxyl carrier protein n=1 Tax=Formosa agariphila (strain DSM 15362 / KCTC 12365 / LMG 23005 / KMM 3901 / M-2Alg 35-1) TaxID=1347342 RepID=T2KLS2_FORAG|nr:acetyl-CoA carboxylase biotin carboxyl carrier protein subunit [Formosa agariphila]CDF78949.1 biotin carboxyl carrier protein [Formosa agariphila KMM 3901]
MSKLTKVIVNDIHHFSLSKNDLNVLDSVETTTNQFHIIQDQISYHAEISNADFQNKSYTVHINNTSYQVDIATELDELIKSMGLNNKTLKQTDVIKAPMPGLILHITVNVGDHIKTNTPLLVLEAMKMENSIVSPRDGIIKAIAIEKGSTVNKGDLLIEFE